MMDLTTITTQELEALATGPTQGDLQAELQRRKQQDQAIAELEACQAQAVALGEELEQLLPEYLARYQHIAQALARNPESSLIPDLADLYRLKVHLEPIIRRYVCMQLYAGNIVDPLITDRLGKPVRGPSAIKDWLDKAGDDYLARLVSDEKLKLTGRRDLYSFPEPANPAMAATQRELLASGIVEANRGR